MLSKNLISDFEQKLEQQIKNCFSKVLYDESDEFYVAADYETKCRIEDLVEAIGLNVYGMSVSVSEFSIQFEFTNEYAEIPNAPKYCSVRWENDGEYDFFIKKDDLNKKWWLNITDINFNDQNTSEKIVREVIKSMNEIHLIKLLKSN
jgi:hypothetical protein